MMARPCEPSLQAVGRRPVRVEIFEQEAVGGHEARETELGNLVGQCRPAWIGRELLPGERGLEQMHVRVGLEETIVGKTGIAAGRAAPVTPQPFVQRVRDRCQRRVTRGRNCQQRERLLVEMRCGGGRAAVRPQGVDEQPVRSSIAADIVIKPMPHGLAPRPVPAEFASHRVSENLPRLDARAALGQHRLAGKIDRLVETAAALSAPTSHQIGRASFSSQLRRRSRTWASSVSKAVMAPFSCTGRRRGSPPGSGSHVLRTSAPSPRAPCRLWSSPPP